MPPRTLSPCLLAALLSSGCVLPVKDVGEFLPEQGLVSTTAAETSGDGATTTSAPPAEATAETTTDDPTTGAPLVCPDVETVHVGDVDIFSTADAEAIAGITRVVGIVSISGTDYSLEPLKCLRKIDQGYIGDNMRTELHGLEALEEVVGELEIGGNDDLPDFTGLSGLKKVGHLWIRQNDGIVSLAGLENLTEVGRLSLVWNPELVDLTALAGLTAIPDLSITRNDKLTSLAGLDHVEQVTDRVIIEDNDLLATCDIAALVAGIDDRQGELCIRDNLADACPDDCP